jgi:hypothetical protein
MKKLRIGFIPLADATALLSRSDETDRLPGEPADGIGTFAGPAFDPHDVAADLTVWTIKRAF